MTLEKNNSLLLRWIYEGDRKSPDDLRKGKFFVVSMLLFTVMVVFGLMFIAATAGLNVFSEYAFWLNIMVMPFVFSVFFIYRKWGKRILLVNIVTVFGFFTNLGIYQSSGGIYTPENLWGIIISAWVFLVADKKSGFIWFSLTIAFYTFLFYAEVNGFRNFKADLDKFPASYYYSNFFIGAIFLCIIMHLHESGKEKYLEELQTAKSEVESQKKIVDQKNKDLTDSIVYARRIQKSLLKSEMYIEKSLNKLKNRPKT